MRLKIFTTSMLILCMVLLLVSPVLVREHPRAHSSRAVRRAYSIELTTYFSVFVLAVAASGTGAFLILRQAREEFREESLANMRTLIESTLRDHERRPSAPEGTESEGG